MTGRSRQAGRLLQMLEHLVAVQLRHHDIEEHQVEGPGGNHLQGFAAIGGSCTA